MHAHDQVFVGGELVVLELLLAREIPMRVKPVRIARGEEQLSCSVSFGKFAFGAGPRDGRRRTEFVTPSRPARPRRGRLIAFEENRWNPQRLLLAGPGRLGGGAGHE